jgi:osmotically-inducible protein OsmY
MEVRQMSLLPRVRIPIGWVLVGLLPIAAMAQTNAQTTSAQKVEKRAAVTSDKIVKPAGTAVSPAMNDEERETARKVRQAIVSDGSLSVYGKNVAILMEKGTLTLRGSVPNEAEKQKIEKLAKNNLGANGRVTNEIEVMAE